MNIRAADDFAAILRQGRRVSCQGLILLGVPTGKAPRLGFAVGRPAGNAVQRNRLRRVIRDWFRIQRAQLPQGDFVVMAKAPLKTMSNVQIRSTMLRLLQLWQERRPS